MWVLVKKSYYGLLAGQMRSFPGGQKHELSDKVIAELREKIGEKNVVKTRAPWDVGKNFKAAKRNKVIENAKAVITKAENLTAECEQLDAKLDILIDSCQQKKQQCEDAYEQACELAKKAGIEWPPSEPEVKDETGPEGQKTEGATGGNGSLQDAADAKGQTVSADSES